RGRSTTETTVRRGQARRAGRVVRAERAAIPERTVGRGLRERTARASAIPAGAGPMAPTPRGRPGGGLAGRRGRGGAGGAPAGGEERGARSAAVEGAVGAAAARTVRSAIAATVREAAVEVPVGRPAPAAREAAPGAAPSGSTSPIRR